ncbi:lipopolysaccharide biosynthesis protein [Tsukamurella strandjordii]|uniref:Oligosaccharide flippase family protein n=2 Tax=Tsukamurella strandjordii TaxID=147577 RepID=A0AA90SHI9_9ACTN|nr:oligosaccharide flippase family protein [Tsukamurella strandjordii]MDP0398829.1 oligosaccharide flippase family protein [Tsukamurella strandjordii]
MKGAVGVMRDVALVSFGKYGQYLITLITLPLCARLLGPYGMGLLTVALSTFFLGALVTDQGITAFLAARIGDPGLSELRGAYGVMRGTMVALLGGLCAATHLFSTSDLLNIATLGLFGGAISAAGEDWVQLGMKRFGVILVQQSVGRALYLLLLVALLPIRPTAHVAVLCMIASSLVPVCWSWVWAWRELGPPGRPRELGDLYRLGAPVLLARMLENSYEQGAAALFAGALPRQAIGLFSASDRPVQATGSLLDAVGWTLLPRMADRKRIGAEFWGVVRRMVLVVAGLGALAALMLTVLAPWIVPILFGAEFTDAVPLLQVGAWSLPGMAVASFVATAVLPVLSDKIGVVAGAATGAVVAFITLGVAFQTHAPMTLVVGIALAETAAATFYLLRAEVLRRRGVAPTLAEETPV